MGSPLVHHFTTSLGLGQVHLPGPKEVPGNKKDITFFIQIKSSPPIKYEHIHPVSHYLRI